MSATPPTTPAAPTPATSLESLRAAVPAKVEAPTNFPGMLKAYQQEIARALPRHLNPDRMCRIALTEFRKNPSLGKCDPKSVFAAIIMSSQLGLEPGVMGQSYLIPYRDECTFVPGWKGLVDLVMRTGRATVWTGAVFRGDEFHYSLGTSPKIEHEPCGESDPNLITHVYAVGRVNGCEWPIVDVWKIEKVKAHRDKYNKVGTRHYSYRHLEMYARKVVLLQVLKYMPASAELSVALDLEYASGMGNQHLETKDVIEGTWMPTPMDDDSGLPSEEVAA